ncbi:Methyl-accepting chemotaxis protein 4 [Enhygromyxa salina]|uniref:Methyl-accepting chemotaxis protein 4 n=1 Tax=Enhygromyxa salina TaxID=215803 RepID=A0A2S9YED2_9BACT|nr:methyl-accepting chemotaxis protein [Enhygromyxa salina]PRQ03392.1 Methyl-accepting chemotaxis protein 4 [Enhygromyxa salina]
MSDVSSQIYQAVREVITRRSYDRAVAATALAERLLHNEGAIVRQEDEIFVGERPMSKDRELLSRMAQSTGLGFALYAGNRRIAVAAVLDAGTPPELGEFAHGDLVDRVLRRREIFKGSVEYREREYLAVCRPLHASGGQDFAPVGMIEAFQDKEAYFDLLAAAARSGVEDQVADVEERADSMESIIHFIDDVARRLQLLALNGNIIAAQAGEHGRAFRVVCRELGSLADQAKNTGQEVRKLIQTMGLERSEQDLMNPFEALEEAVGPDAGSTPSPSP